MQQLITPRVSSELRDRDIYRLWRDGVPVFELSRRYGLTERHIYRVLNKQRELKLIPA